jgi:hypothetical protein
LLNLRRVRILLLSNVLLWLVNGPILHL